MLVVGVLDSQGTVRWPGLSATPAEKKKKVEDKKSKSVKSDKPTKSSSTSSSQPTSASTDQRFKELDQKWSERLNQLEAFLLAKTLDRPHQKPTFSTVKVAPTHSPPANVGRKEHFIKPTERLSSQHSD